MTLDTQTRAARMFTVGFEGKAMTPELKGLIDRGVGGVIFFARNIGEPSELAELTSEIKRYAGRPLTLTIDHEGGRVTRLRQGFTDIPSMRALGATGSPDLATSIGKIIGAELRATGFDLNFAPVLDVDTNPDNPIIATRSLSQDAQVVSQMGVALLQGIQSTGVGACGKHFPGHGDTHQDSHLELPHLPHSLERLNSIELPPFEAAVNAGVSSIMTAHVVFDPIDDRYPATMSRETLHGILRKRMNFKGLVVTDDLEMKAITEHYGIEEAVIRGIKAGVDMFLCCHTPSVMHQAIDTVIKGIESGVLPEDSIAASNDRLQSFNAKYTLDAPSKIDLSALNCDAHKKVVEDILSRVDPATAAPGVDPTEIMEQLRPKDLGKD